MKFVFIINPIWSIDQQGKKTTMIYILKNWTIQVNYILVCFPSLTAWTISLFDYT